MLRRRDLAGVVLFAKRDTTILEARREITCCFDRLDTGFRALGDANNLERAGDIKRPKVVGDVRTALARNRTDRGRAFDLRSRGGGVVGRRLRSTTSSESREGDNLSLFGGVAQFW